jgi:hypothetical protein
MRSNLITVADESPYFSQDTTDELMRLAKQLHGGWRYESGIVPTITLTLEEARRIASALGLSG